MTKYDLNIWDKVGYETEYAEEGWYIAVYEFDVPEAVGSSASFVEELSFPLTEEEAKSLTLGKSEAEGGDYTSDPDFWLDVEGFFSIYKNVPPRVESLLKALPE